MRPSLIHRARVWASLLVWGALSVTLVFFVFSAYRYKRELRSNEEALGALLAESRCLQSREPAVLAQERSLEARLQERRQVASEPSR